MLSAAGALQWLHDVTAPALSFDELTAEAERWDPGAEGLTFLPYLAGERTPHPDPDARGAFAGLSLRHDRGALVRAVLEGVAFGLRDGLDLVGELGGAISSGRVSGGGARSDLWLTIIASVLELPLERVRVDAARRLAQRSSAVSPPGSGPTFRQRSRRRCRRPNGSSRTRSGSGATASCVSATWRCIRPCGTFRKALR